MMSLEEAIEHCEDIISDGKCDECENEHRQLAAWLRELQERRESDRWIPVSERMPEENGTYLVTITGSTAYVEHFINVVISEFYEGRFLEDMKVTAWKHFHLPEPYQA